MISSGSHPVVNRADAAGRRPIGSEGCETAGDRRTVNECRRVLKPSAAGSQGELEGRGGDQG
jgi:hypothetical protein